MALIDGFWWQIDGQDEDSFGGTIEDFLKHTTKQHLEEYFIGNTSTTHFLVFWELGGFEVADSVWQHFFAIFLVSWYSNTSRKLIRVIKVWLNFFLEKHRPLDPIWASYQI